MEPLPLRDCLSVTGVSGYDRSMAVGAQGQLVFKKSLTELVYYDVQELSSIPLKFSKQDPLYDDCYIYDFAFLRGGTLAVCLKHPISGELYICEGVIDYQEKIVDISGTVYSTKISTIKGRNVQLLLDEAGVVLISYPIKWTGKDYLELFHVSNYLCARSGDKYVISLTSKDKIDATFGNVFISRNHLYMFYGDNYSKFLLVPLAGSNCGKCEIRSSQGPFPSGDYVAKTTLVFEDFVLVYAYMNTGWAVKPNLYVLNLTNLKWILLNLSLSHHFPNGKVVLQKFGEDLFYMHGDCNQSGCTEKAHLYQISVEPVMGIITSRPRSESKGYAFGCLQYPSVSNLTTMAERRTSSVSSVPTRASVSSDTPLTPVDSVAPPIYKSDAPIAQRFKKKQSKEEMTRRRLLSNAVSKVSSASVDSNECVKRSSSCSSLHWGADMAEQSGRSLQDQIKLANEMGYGEDVVIAALNLMQGQSDQPYQAFESTNSMLDFLNQATNRQEPKLKLSLFNGSTSPDKERQPRVQSVSRSSSFHIGSSRPSRSDSHDLFRLIRTLDKEKERDKREVEQQFTRLKTRIHELEHTCEHQKQEIEKLKGKNSDHAAELEERNKRLIKVLDEMNDLRDKYEKETIKSTRLSKDLQDQKELIDHRRRKYEEEQAISQKNEVERLEEIERLARELQQKSALLDEQTAIVQNLERQNTSLQTGTLLAEIEAKMESRLRRDEEIAQENAMLKRLFDEIKSKIPDLEAAKQRAEVAIKDCERKRQEEGDALRREINALLEKTTAECCICLSTKPNVVFLPCKHLAICQGCESDSPPLSECPTCRTKIEDTLQIYS